MAFHVACPITCRRICDCELGFAAGPRGGGFAGEIERLEGFLRDPWCVRSGGGGGGGETVQVLVPRVDPAPPRAFAAAEDGDEVAAAASAQAKRAAMQQQAVAASVVAEDYVRRLEAGDGLEVQGEAAGEDQGSAIVKVMCRICFSGESEGSNRATKMLSCKFCNKKYHKICLKSWAEYRDLFHWSSWACPSCRICEVCRRAGDPNKLMYCKRCDAAYHCYCQQPPHKNVGHGPYLCPKHTRCHSCGSSVPGSGLSTRWFLGYTCCDACGRLFVKGNYCPVCLKVYRDSETTPMVCCDVCERWVHCQCDGISDEKYQQFQADQNLYYKCAACRGDCYQIKDIDDAVQELWKRRDEADHDQIASLREAAGLPSQDEIFSLSPYSDDEQGGRVIQKNDHGRSLKFSFKGLADRPAKSLKETTPLVPNKKHVKKKGYQIKFVRKSEELYQNSERQHDAVLTESSIRDKKIVGLESCKAGGGEFFSSSLTKSPSIGEMKSSVNLLGGNSQSFVKEIVANNVDPMSRAHNEPSKVKGLHIKDYAGKNENKNETIKGTKLVIHLGTKNRNTSSSPRSETSTCHREPDIPASNGGEDAHQPKTEWKENYALETHGRVVPPDGGKGARFDQTYRSRNSKRGSRENNLVKLGKIHEIHKKTNGNVAGDLAETTLSNDEFLPKKQLLETPLNLPNDGHGLSQSNDLKPLLKFKFKNSYFEQGSSWAPRGEEENAVKGQRSKRKRPTEKVGSREDVSFVQLHQESPIDEAMDAKILQKLGKDAVGKRVEVHQLSDSSWHRGVVSSTIEGTSSLKIHLDDGRTTTLELGKQGVRFVAQKRKRTS